MLTRLVHEDGFYDHPVIARMRELHQHDSVVVEGVNHGLDARRQIRIPAAEVRVGRSFQGRPEFFLSLYQCG